MSIGRVGNNQLTRQLMANLKTQLTQQERLFEQISSNKRILRASDDPTGASISMNLHDQLNMLEEYDNVISSGDVWTNVTNTALDSGVSTWKRVNEVAISAADGTKTAADRQGMAEELEQLLQHMVQIANTTHGDRYIFGGSSTDTPPFRSEIDANTGKVTGVFYEGNNQVRKVKTKEEGTVDIGVLGSNAGSPDKPGSFIDSRTGTNVFKTIIDLRDKLLNNDISGISGANGIIKDIETASQSLVSSQVRLGGSQEVLQLDRNRIIEQTSDVGQFLSEVEEADIAKLILELNNAQNVYEAALAAGGRLLQTGLLNFI
ncbi:MAG: flagellar hook-associated protein 3 [Waddliaceae bacterium]|nr:flagellar hook-associated protein 3 [Waddliaceae bacterium]